MASIYKSPAGQRAIQARYAAALAAWPVPATHQTLPTRHGDTFVVACGDPAATPLVLLHGAGTNAAMWSHEVDAYSRAHRVLAVDLLGEPGNSAPNRPSWASPAFAEWLEDVLDAVGAEAAALVGLSQGGWAALKFAVAWPERVRALALLNPGGVVPDRGSFVLKALPLSLLGQPGIRRLNRLVLGGQPVPPEVEQTMALHMTHFRARLGVLPIFSDRELARLSMPARLLVGARDPLRDAARISARLGRLVPHLEATTLPEAGHALLRTAPYVLPFLEWALARSASPER